MVKTLIAGALIGFMHFIPFDGGKRSSDHSEPMPAESFWVRSETGVWLGNYDTWYKIDQATEARLLNAIKLSRNKRKWKSSTNVAWQDKQGRWLTISNNRLLWTEDNKHWTEVPAKAWQGIDGKWYRFDANWELWEVKE
jgi:hypothetical protein